MIRGVIYDLDNTISRTFLVKLLVGMILFFRYPLVILGFLSEGSRGIMGSTMTELLERHAPPHKREKVVDTYERLLEVVAPLARTVDPHEITPRGVRIAIFSNSSTRTIQTILEKNRIDTSDIILVSSEDVGNKKPAPDGIKKILREWGLDPGEVAMVGDSPEDIIAGKRAGVVTIGVETPLHSFSSLVRAGADYIVARIGDVKPLIEHLNSTGPRNPRKQNNKKHLSTRET